MVRRRAFSFFSRVFSFGEERKKEREKKKEREEREKRRGRGKNPSSELFSFFSVGDTLLFQTKPKPLSFSKKTRKSALSSFQKEKEREGEKREEGQGERERETRRRTRSEGRQGAREGEGRKTKKTHFFPSPPLSPEKLKALSGGTSGCCGNSTQIIVTPGVRDSRNSTVSYVPKSAEDCHLRCAADSTCLTASVFSNKGNLFCNLFAASTCRYSRLQCNPTDSDAPTFVVHGSWLFPCRSPKGGISEDDTALCTVGHGHGVDGWHEGHGVFVSGGNGGGGHNHG
jgi:hypothetical protein